jgi:HPt (histidine-containing phosphotransfer) domain-containing protein
MAVSETNRTAPGEIAQTAAPVLDLRHLNHQTLGDAELRRVVLQLFLGEVSKYVGDVANASDRAAWRMAMHTLKGVALNLGAFRLAQICRQHENAELPVSQLKKQEALAALAQAVAATRSAIQAVIGQG